jgi:hypothetical protein
MKVKFIFNLISPAGTDHGHVYKIEDVPWIESGMEIIFPYFGDSFKIQTTSLSLEHDVKNRETSAWICNRDGSAINDNQAPLFKANGWIVVDIGFGQGML